MTDEYSSESGHRATADAIIDIIRDVDEIVATGDQRSLKWDNPEHREMVLNRFDDYPESEAILPGFGPRGHGDNARNDCGNPNPFTCNKCAHVVEFGRTCAQSVCARCGVAWVRDSGINNTAKLRRVRKEKHQNTPDKEHQKFHHQTISAPLSWYYDLAKAGYTLKEAQEKTQEVVKAILDEMRAQGLLVRHSYRGENDDGSVAKETDDRGEWKQRLNSGRDWVGDVRDELAWNPHYHCIVVADFLKGGDLTDCVEDETGWVIHRIADDDGISIPNDGAMARATTYTLSHCDIQVREDANNRSAVWKIGSFDGDIIKSDSRFSARPSDLAWADETVRRIAVDTLGLQSGTTDCGADLPPVDDPDELARRILEELFPDDDRPARGVSADAVLHHVAEGNISVDVETTSGGGGSVTVRDAFGEPVGSGGWTGGSDLPDVPSNPTYSGGDGTVATKALDVDDDHSQPSTEDHTCDHHDHGDDQDDRECDGTLIPLQEARERGLLEDDDWCRDAPHIDELREADQEWPDDLPPWRSSQPDGVRAIGAG